MRYLGGKSRLAKEIVTAILADTSERETWYEPFIGGGSVCVEAAPHFRNVFASDVHEDLILMWQAAIAGWQPPAVPLWLYRELKNAQPSALRGFAGFGCAFGGKWFDSYAPHRVGSSCRAVARQAVALKDARVFRASFGAWFPPSGVVYCDPPYAETTKYKTGDFDTLAFWSEVKRLARTHTVYVSEFKCPILAKVVWEKERRNEMAKKQTVVDRLYRVSQ